MIEKQVASLADAVADVADGATVMIGGFGTAGMPSELIDALIDWLHEAGRSPSDETLGVVLNAGAYTHTSVALGDAIKAIAIPVIEVHLSNVHAREPFRHHSYLSPACAGIVVGFGVAGYALAIDGLVRTAKARADARRCSAILSRNSSARRRGISRGPQAPGR